MLRQSQYHGIQPILVVTSAVDPIGSLPMLSHNESHVERVRSAIKQLSETHAKKLSAMYGQGDLGLQVIDVYQQFEHYALKHGYTPLYQHDGIHLSPLGAQLIYDAFSTINW